MGRDYWDVHPDGKWGWEVKKERGDRASGRFDRKEDAVRCGVEIAKKAGGGLRIKRKDRTIQDERSYDNDPFPPRGLELCDALEVEAAT